MPPVRVHVKQRKRLQRKLRLVLQLYALRRKRKRREGNEALAQANDTISRCCIKLAHRYLTLSLLTFNRGELGKGMPRFTEYAQLEMHGEQKTKTDFTFFLVEIKRLMKLLQLPASGTFRWPLQGAKFHTYNCFECLLITLYRLHEGASFRCMCDIFGLAECRLSEAFNVFTKFLHDTYVGQLHDLSLWAHLAKESARAFSNKGFPLKNCFAFLDGKIYRTCKPEDAEAEHYSWCDPKKKNGYNYQAFIAACGLHIGFFGPGDARRVDAYHYRNMGLHDQIVHASQECELQHGEGGFHTFSDGGYPISEHNLVGYKGNKTDDQSAFNHSCHGKGRVGVEWKFANKLQQYPMVDNFKKMKQHLSATAHWTYATAIIHNWHVCCYGGQVSSYFNVEPPSLREYFTVGFD